MTKTIHTTPLSEDEVEALHKAIRIERHAIKELLYKDKELMIRIDGSLAPDLESSSLADSAGSSEITTGHVGTFAPRSPTFRL